MKKMSVNISKQIKNKQKNQKHKIDNLLNNTIKLQGPCNG